MLVMLGACTASPPPAKDAPATNRSDAMAPAPVVATPREASAGACRSDKDCRTHSSYCQLAPCVCRVLASDEPDPQCAGGKVTCFADPCMRKAAACQEGRCVLVAASRP